MPTSDNVTYHGRCHCGGVRFTLRCAPIESAVMCNCSICIRRNARMSEAYYPEPEFTLEQGETALAVYRFGDHDVNHYFCSTCGIYPFHDSVLEPGRYRVNLGCLEGFDPSTLPVRRFDGRNLL